MSKDEQENALVIAGVDFTRLGYPRQFTVTEREILEELKGKHGYEEALKPFGEDGAKEVVNSMARRTTDALVKRYKRELEKRPRDWDSKLMTVLERQLGRLGHKRVGLRILVLESLDQRLAKECEKEDEDWDNELVDELTEALKNEQALVAELSEQETPGSLQNKEKRDRLQEKFLQVEERVHLEMTWRLAKEANATRKKLETWLRDIGEDNAQYLAAREIVERGTFLAATDRAQKHQRKRRSRDLN